MDQLKQIILNHCNEHNNYGEFSDKEKLIIFEEWMKVIQKDNIITPLLYTPAETNNIVRRCLQTAPLTIKMVSEQTGINQSTLYNFVRDKERNLLSENMNILIQWLRTKQPNILETIINIYNKEKLYE